MDLGMIGLGKMGSAMTQRLMLGGHRMLVYDRQAATIDALVAVGAAGTHSVAELVAALAPPRTVWLMVPAGDPTEATVQALASLLDPNDVIVDGGNSNYHDTIRRGQLLDARGIHLIDVGVSGGVWGLSDGYALMIGGDEAVVERLRVLWETLAPASDRGWGRVGPVGAGHYTKMIHNGIEYGMMQALAEGLAIMHNKLELQLDLQQITAIWQHGVIRSWLLDLTHDILATNPSLEDIQPWVMDTGEGRWTVQEAIDLDVPAPVITLALLSRLASRESDSYSFKLLAAIRRAFGGHAVRRTRP